jgi:hypothetical protein
MTTAHSFAGLGFSNLHYLNLVIPRFDHHSAYARAYTDT